MSGRGGSSTMTQTWLHKAAHFITCNLGGGSSTPMTMTMTMTMTTQTWLHKADSTYSRARPKKATRTAKQRRNKWGQFDRKKFQQSRLAQVKKLEKQWKTRENKIRCWCLKEVVNVVSAVFLIRTQQQFQQEICLEWEDARSRGKPHKGNGTVLSVNARWTDLWFPSRHWSERQSVSDELTRKRQCGQVLICQTKGPKMMQSTQKISFMRNVMNQRCTFTRSTVCPQDGWANFL